MHTTQTEAVHAHSALGCTGGCLVLHQCGPDCYRACQSWYHALLPDEVAEGYSAEGQEHSMQLCSIDFIPNVSAIGEQIDLRFRSVITEEFLPTQFRALSPYH
jgi:hypothetical protein